MIFKSIKIKNYRQFRDTDTIDLNSSNKNINVIVGSNGSGKTNLSNAIQWCLYGKESIDDTNDFPILNLNTLDGLKEGESANVVVEILIKTDFGEEYTLTRTKTMIKQGSKCISKDKVSGELSAYFHRTNEAMSPSYDISYPATLVDRLIPEKIREYFFFDGEKLEQYFKSTSSEKIQQSIFQISQLDLLNQIVTKLDSVKSKLRNEIADNNPGTQNLNEEINLLAKEIITLQDDVKKSEIEKKEALNNMLDFIDKYKKYGGDEAKKRLKKNEELQEIISIQNKHLLERQEEKREKLLANSYIFLFYDNFKNTISIFSEAERIHLIPPNIDPGFVKKLLEEGKCICGEEISDNNKNKNRRNNIEELFKKVSVLGNEPNKFMGIENDIQNIIQYHTKNIINEINFINNEIKQINSKIENAKKERDENIAFVGNIKLENVENFQNKIIDLQGEIEKLTQKIDLSIFSKNEKQKLKEDKEKELSQVAEKNVLSNNLGRFMAFCTEAQDEANIIVEKVMSEIRKEISEKTEKYYKELQWKKDEIIKINIDEDYSITALNNGRNKFGAFAAGENALLAMSFIFALNSVSGFNVPIILDTALGRISTEPRANFASNLSKYLTDTQLILLLTQSEYSPEVSKNLEGFINHHYELKLEDNSNDLETYFSKED